jgi:MFS family permease
MQAKAFARGQRRMLVTTIVGYTLFYFLRKNLSLAMPGLAQDYGITKTSLGLFLTLHGVVYGVGKFVAGPISDRSRPRIFLMGGLLLALLANVVFGFGPVLAKLFAGGAEGAAFTTALITVLGIAWVANGFCQSMGNPPCLKLLSHWVPPEELATKLAIWNSSHSIGAGIITILCGYIMGLGALGADGVGVGMWQWCFWTPAIIAAVGLEPSGLLPPDFAKSGGKIVSNDDGVPGVVDETCGEAFRAAFKAADLIVAKGQANFETMSERTDKPIAFLFLAKCPVVCREVGAEPKTIQVLLRNFHA